MKKKNSQSRQFRLDQEFATLVPPRSEAERDVLRENLSTHGSLSPLIIWKAAGRRGKDLLIMDYEVYRMCRSLKIVPKTKYMSFKTRDDAIEFVIARCLGNRNLTVYEKGILALRWEPILKRRAAKNQTLSCGRGRKGVRNSDEAFVPCHINKILANKIGVSPDTIAKIKRLNTYASDELKQRLVKGTSSIAGACQSIDSKHKAERTARALKQKVNFRNPRLRKDIINEIICGDVLKILKTIGSEHVDLIITSPPYGNRRDYGKGKEADNPKYQEWLDGLYPVWVECERVLVPGGRLCVNVDSMLNTHPEDMAKERKRPVFCDLVSQMRSIGQFRYRERITWCKKNIAGNVSDSGTYCSPCDPHLRHDSEDIIIWSKGSYELFPPVEGIAGDITDTQFRSYTVNTWEIHPETRNRGGHPCPFCEELPRRLALLYSYPTSIVMDIFNGAGTTTKIAADLGRKYIGIDQNRVYCDFAKKRTDKAYNERRKQEKAEQRKAA